MLVFSVVVSVSSSSWLVCWMMMEVSSFFFVPILYGVWSVSSVMIGLKYFLVQSIGSSLFLFSILWKSSPFGGWEWISESEMGFLTYFSMMLKLGIFPFSGWMIHISEGLSWKNFFLLSSIQEVIPLVMISKFGGGEKELFFFVFLGLFVLVVFCFENYSFHWMVMVSSLFNVCWMVVASLVSKEGLIFFLFVYFSTLFMFFWVLESLISFGSLAVVSGFSLFKGSKVVFLFFSFMIMGIPPFGSFIGKAEVLWSLVSEGMGWFGLFLFFLSSVFMFLYLKISLCVSLSSKGKGKGSFVKGMGLAEVLFFSVLSITFMIWLF